MHRREIEAELLEPRDGSLRGIEVHVEAEHHKRVYEGGRAREPAHFEHELGVSHEQHASP